MDNPLYIVLALCCALALALALYLFFAIRKRSYVSAIYSSKVRDCRFAYALLKMYFPKNVIRSPYLLKNPAGISPKADVVAVLRGGILIITVLDKKGFYLTPSDKEWTLTAEEGIVRLPNAVKQSSQYENAIDDILIKAGIPSQPVIRVALLSNDKAKFDPLYPESILTGDMLIPFCKNLNKTPIMGAKTQKQIMEALNRHHKSCKSYNEKNLYNITPAESEGDAPPAPGKEETKSADAPEITVESATDIQQE